jgi:hypothetical protein
MRLLGFVFLLSPCALAQSVAPDAACGSPVAAFKVSHGKTQHPTPSPGDGNAMLYVLSSVDFAGPETVALGIDGTWVGAVNGNAYFSVPIAPGQHHLCARFSGRTGALLMVPLFKVRDVALHSLDVSPGGTYYVRVQLGLHSDFKLDLLDPDEAKLLLSRAEFSTSHLK